ncbi:hypothetical protein RDI58_017652 [Solanum bulbocastanum]|uniref:Uncharacterized protein n=1 Tax=Solanum bulbocastanum TaxID=147425 RepID=A0AAN8YC76_SOLBU
MIATKKDQDNHSRYIERETTGQRGEGNPKGEGKHNDQRKYKQAI